MREGPKKWIGWVCLLAFIFIGPLEGDEAFWQEMGPTSDDPAPGQMVGDQSDSQKPEFVKDPTVDTGATLSSKLVDKAQQPLIASIILAFPSIKESLVTAKRLLYRRSSHAPNESLRSLRSTVLLI